MTVAHIVKEVVTLANKKETESFSMVSTIDSLVSKYAPPKPFTNAEIKSNMLAIIDKSISRFNSDESGCLQIKSVSDLERLVKLRVLLQTLYKDETTKTEEEETILLDVNNPLVKQIYEEMFMTLNDNNADK